MRLGTEAKVGLVVFSALVVLIGVYWFLGGISLGAQSYPVYALFPNAQKLDKGADIRMAGVKIGVVSDINLTKNSQARVEMLIWNENKIPSDSIARITTGGFIGDNFVEIIPGTSSSNIKPNQKLNSQQLVQMEQVMQDVSVLLVELKKSAKGVNAILGDKEIINTIKDTLKTLDKSAKTASQMIASANGIVGSSSPQISRILENLSITSENATRLSKNLNEIVATDARPNINKIMKQAASMMENLNQTISDVDELVSMGKQGAAGLGQVLDKVNNTAAQAEEMSKNLNQASAGIKDLATDQQMKCDLKQTIKNINDATEQAKELVTSLNKKYGKYYPPAKKVEKANVPDYGLVTNSLWNTGKGQYRVDANYTFAGTNNSMYRIGAYNIGESTKLNLQAGKVFSFSDTFRYGLYASRIGIGYDHRFGPLIISSDIFRPNSPEMELRGVVNITPTIGLYTGVLDMFHPEYNDLMVGLRYNSSN